MTFRDDRDGGGTGLAVELQCGPGVRARLGSLLVRLFVRPVIALCVRFPSAPWPYGLVDLAAQVLPAVRGVDRTRIRLAHCDAEYTRPLHGDSAGAGAILYLHGGAFLVGGLRSHRRLVSRLVRDTGVPALAVNYRKLTAASVTEALGDCLDGYRRLLNTGVPPESIALVGDSAGGYFALQIALQASRRGMPTPGALACISPLVDPDPASKLADPRSAGDALFPAQAFEWMWERVLRAEADPDAAVDLLRYPATAPSPELAALPPMFVQVGGGEALAADAERLVGAVRRAGGAARLQVFPGQVHVFQIAADLLPEARVAVAEIVEHVGRHIVMREKRAA